MSDFSKMTVSSALGDYHVQETASWMGALGVSMGTRDALIIDKNLWSENKAAIARICDETRAVLLDVPARNAKTLRFAMRLLETLSRVGLRRDSIIFVVGGGSIMDIGGFVASVYMRGIEWVYIPTTLLSQADSCIGGKTSLNLRGYKNMVGTFWPPRSVVIDRKLLLTLPRLEVLSGIGEMLHFFFVAGDDMAALIPDMLDPCVSSAFPEIVDGARRSLEIKKLFVEQDERDRGLRRLLNFGHTFAHAVEALYPDEAPHGLAVALGMTMACNLSQDLGFLEPETCQQMTALTKAVCKEWAPPKLNIPDLVGTMVHDKKQSRAETDALRLILTNGPGTMFEFSVKLETLKTLLPAAISRLT